MLRYCRNPDAYNHFCVLPMRVVADVGLDVFLWNILGWMAEFNFPGTDGVQQQIVVNEGDTLFVVGANGSGKSSLMQLFFYSASLLSGLATHKIL